MVPHRSLLHHGGPGKRLGRGDAAGLCLLTGSCGLAGMMKDQGEIFLVMKARFGLFLYAARETGGNAGFSRFDCPDV